MFYYLLSLTFYMNWLMAIMIIGLLCSPILIRKVYRKYKDRGFQNEWKRVDWHSGNTHILSQLPVKRILEKIGEERRKDGTP
ncbi:MAG: hypothetical protein ACOCWZ_11375 [Spirochaetota bacterium]